MLLGRCWVGVCCGEGRSWSLDLCCFVAALAAAGMHHHRPAAPSRPRSCCTQATATPRLPLSLSQLSHRHGEVLDVHVELLGRVDRPDDGRQVQGLGAGVAAADDDGDLPVCASGVWSGVCCVGSEGGGGLVFMNRETCGASRAAPISPRECARATAFRSARRCRRHRSLLISTAFVLHTARSNHQVNSRCRRRGRPCRGGRGSSGPRPARPPGAGSRAGRWPSEPPRLFLGAWFEPS